MKKMEERKNLEKDVECFVSAYNKLVSMMQSLGGFMVLTWSATIIYAICSQAWPEK